MSHGRTLEEEPIGFAALVEVTDMMWWHGGWTALDWVLMGLFMLVFWAAVVAAIVWLVRSIGLSRSQGDDHDERPHDPSVAAHRSPREILDERYARGELTDEEYRTRRDILASK